MAKALPTLGLIFLLTVFGKLSGVGRKEQNTTLLGRVTAC